MYEVHSVFKKKEINNVFEEVKKAIENNKDFIFYKQSKILFDKERMITFMNNNTCIGCGSTGYILKSEKMVNCSHSVYGNNHLNFYTSNNVMMTVDHIVLKSKGGANHHSNYNTMCRLCNTRRGNSYENLETFLELCKSYPLQKYLEDKREQKRAQALKKEERKNKNKKIIP